MPENHLVTRDRWGEFVASRFQSMTEGQSEEFLISSTNHAMAMQLSKTAEGLVTKVYDPNVTTRLHVRCVGTKQESAIAGWKFDESVLGTSVKGYFGNPASQFGEDGVDPLIQVRLIPKAANRPTSELPPANRFLSLKFGPTSIGGSHVGVMRHIMYSQHMDALRHLSTEVKLNQIPMERLRQLLEWRPDRGIQAADYVEFWPESNEIVAELTKHAGLSTT
jgi:hypothetical protein